MSKNCQSLLAARARAGRIAFLALGACGGGGAAPTATSTTGGTVGVAAAGGRNTTSAGGAANASGGLQAGASLGGAGGGRQGGVSAAAGVTSAGNGGVSTSGGASSMAAGSGATNAGGLGGATAGGLGGATAGGLGGATAGGGMATGAAGSNSATGGSSTGGGAKSAGGTANIGGVTSSVAGSPAIGGAGGAGGQGGMNAACPGGNATEFALVSSWLNNTSAKGALPAYAYSNIGTNFPAGAAFDKLACSIVKSCSEFAPAATDWVRKCEAVIASAIVAESSYNPSSVVTDTYATRIENGVTANDPTVGLLQIRLSSTVHDYNYYGPPAKMTAIGCEWPAAFSTQAETAPFWLTAGGTTYLSFMQDVACNVALATWYYFYNATGNGGPNAVWIANYCAGQGVAGTMLTGLLSHLMGGSYARPLDVNHAYPWGIECCAAGNPTISTCTGCTGRFAAFMGIGTSGARPNPDPFREQLAPEPAKYCK